MKIKYEIKDKIQGCRNATGSCYWESKNSSKNKITISTKSDNLDRTIIHETLHAALHRMEDSGEHTRIIKNINNNERLIFRLAELMAENLNVNIKQDKLI